MGTYDHDTDTYTYDKMDPEVKKNWIAALRSGEFLQANGYLKALEKRQRKLHHCCLGVLAEICQAPEFVKYEVIPSNETENVKELWKMGEGGSGALSDEFMASIKLETEAADELASMNDNGTSFKGIANWIERNL